MTTPAKTVEVAGTCDTCQFLIYTEDGFNCAHGWFFLSQERWKGFRSFTDDDYDPDAETPPIPGWCPLRTGDVLVTLRAKA